METIDYVNVECLEIHDFFLYKGHIWKVIEFDDAGAVIILKVYDEYEDTDYLPIPAGTTVEIKSYFYDVEA